MAWLLYQHTMWHVTKYACVEHMLQEKGNLCSGVVYWYACDTCLTHTVVLKVPATEEVFIWILHRQWTPSCVSRSSGHVGCWQLSTKPASGWGEVQTPLHPHLPCQCHVTHPSLLSHGRQRMQEKLCLNNVAADDAALLPMQHADGTLHCDVHPEMHDRCYRYTALWTDQLPL